MIRLLTAASLLALLAACNDGQPFTFTPVDLEGEVDPAEPVPEEEDDPVSDDGVPESVGGNVETVTYRPGSNFLSVQITSLDSTPVTAVYERNPALDVGGYRAFSQQEDPLDRMFIGMAKRTADGATQGVLVMDGGQFTKFFGGTHFQRTGAYTPHIPRQPDNGLVSYAGRYVGLLNINAPRPNEALPVPAGTNPDFIPAQPARVRGDVFVNADFADNSVNGAISNRQLLDFGNAVIPSVFLIPTEIDEDGRFSGDVENANQDGVGTYAGTFGGSRASGIAAGVHLDGDFLPGVENEEEYGIFVLNKCGTANDANICDTVNP